MSLFWSSFLCGPLCPLWLNNLVCGGAEEQPYRGLGHVGEMVGEYFLTTEGTEFTEVVLFGVWPRGSAALPGFGFYGWCVAARQRSSTGL